MSSAQIAAVTAQRAGSIFDALLRNVRRDRWLFAISLVALTCAYIAAPITGAKPDYAILWFFLAKVFEVLALGLSVALGIKLVRLAFVEKSDAPTRELVAMVYGFLAERDRLATFAVTIAVYFTFTPAFAVLKAGIAIMHPFSWDLAFLELDRVLHFGKLPHEWLMPLLGGKTALFILNVLYNVWYVLVIGGMVTAAFMLRNRELRQQYLMSFLGTYFIGGVVVATIFSSAGPCYLEPLGLGNTYADLMAALKSASEVYPIWALDIQDALWAGYIGERPGSGGISAFPSMHVGTAVVMALGAYRLNRALGIAMWVYAVIIWIGSFMLAWHYAVDGYAGALLAVVIWKAAGVYARRSEREGEAAIDQLAAEPQTQAT